MTTSNTVRNRSIDALRGIAALMVMFLHVGYFFAKMPGTEGDGAALIRVFQQFDIGRMGITVFFIISGFVIPKSIRLDRARPLKKFLVKRFYRLYPLFWFSMILGLFAIWYLHDRGITLSLVAGNATMVPAFFSERFVIGLYWTLETELIFYLIVFLLTWFGWLRRLELYLVFTICLYLLLIGFLIIPQLHPSLPHWTATPYHLSLMFLGVIYRHQFDRDGYSFKLLNQTIETRTLFFLQLIVILSIPVLVLFQHLTGVDSAHVPDAVAYLVGIAIFFAGVKLWRRPPRFAVYLGVISYSIYLLHPVVFSFLEYIAQTQSWFAGWHLSAYLIISIALTIILCHISYLFIEKPANDFGHLVADRLE